MTTSVVAKLRHPQWGLCELVRVEATDWIVRVESTGVQYRVSSERRGQFEVVHDEPEPSDKQRPRPKIRAVVLDNAAARNARRVIESLRIGLPSLDGSTRRLAVGFSEMERLIGSFLHDIDSDGGGAMIMKGAYGQGKTFALSILEETAFESGFATCRTEIDATENALCKPHHIYRDFIRNLRLPGCREHGALGLASKVCNLLDREGKKTAQDRMIWLEQRVGCFPISWLLSDPGIVEKPALLGVFEGDPNYPARLARKEHAISPPQKGRQWAVFRYGTQGDFAGFVFSGIGPFSLGCWATRACCLLWMKWRSGSHLDWREQSRAGNLVGGLIWGATADDEKRKCRRNVEKGSLVFPPIQQLRPSPRFRATADGVADIRLPLQSRNYVGVAIAMTPRDYECPRTPLVADTDQFWSAKCHH